MRHLLIASALLGTATPLAAHAPETRLRLEVGPGVTAGFRSPTSTIECSDNARCGVDLPAGTSIEVYARSARPVKWQGCDSITPQNRCVAHIGRDPVRITVR